MKTRLSHRIGALAAAVVAAGITAPVTQAGHEDFGERCALLLTQHRPEACALVLRREAAASAVTIVEPSGFDWGDAGIGAAGALGLTFLAGGLLIVARASQRKPAVRGQ